MKRAQKIAQAAAAATCGGQCQEAEELRAQIEETAVVMDRDAAQIRGLIENRDRLLREVRELRARLAVAESQRGLRP